MKYEMPALADRLKQAVVAWNLIEKDRLEKMGDNQSSRYISVCITLASLTADPVGFTFTQIDENSDGTVYQSREFSIFKDQESDDPVYTAPPVPVLKPVVLPEADHETEDGYQYFRKETAIKFITDSGYEVKE